MGTRRYMAPEVLDFIPDAENNVFIEENFQCFLNSDIYSLGLVLWEISSRTIVDGKFYSYKYKSPDQKSTHQAVRAGLCGLRENQNIFSDIEPEPYKMPFEDLAPNDPDVEQMRQIVSVKNERPEFRTELSKTIFHSRKCPKKT